MISLSQKKEKNGYEVETMEHGTLIDFSSYDFYGMNRNKRIEKTLRETLDGYGVGSCGPRGFYGTIDTHLHLEKALADFAQVDDAIIFSDNSSTIASVIPAFAKRGDLLMVDAGVCSSVYTGCKLSRARIITFKHQDYEDLREQLLKVEKEDKHRGTSPAKQRRFIVTEGISRNFGTLLDLPKVLSLKNEFGFRLIVDETISFGVLGKNGRGVTEHFGLPIDSIDLLTGSLETSFASVGGFCVGSQAIVDHQRLSAAGYVFSASAPAYTSTVAQEALAMLQEGNGQYEADLANRIESFHASFRKQLGGSGKKRSPLTIISDVVSPIVHIGFRTDESNRNIPSSLLKAGYTEIFSDREQQHKFLCHLREYLLNNGGFLCNVPVFARGTIVTVPQPSLRLTLRLTQPSTFQTRLLMKIKEFCSRCPVA